LLLSFLRGISPQQQCGALTGRKPGSGIGAGELEFGERIPAGSILGVE